MSAESAVVAILAAHAPLTAAVSTRIYPDAATQSTALPLLVYSKIDGESFNNLLGQALIARSRFEIKAWATARADAEATLDLCVAALAAQSIPIEGRGGGFDEEVGLYSATLEFDYWA